MKKYLFIILAAIILVYGLLKYSNAIIDQGEDGPKDIPAGEIGDEFPDEIYIKVRGRTLKLTLIENVATNTFVKKLQKDDFSMQMTDHDGIEMRGNLGFRLPTENYQTNTRTGDVVLYGGDQIGICYNANFDNLTKLGRIEDVTSEYLKNIFNEGKAKVTFTLRN